MTAAGGGRRGRAAERQAFLAERSGEFDRAALAAALTERLAADHRAAEAAAGVAAAGLIARIFAASNKRRWVPIGPSVIRSRQRSDTKRSTGRVRDLQVSTDGTRAYAATAKGGVWYTADAGALWSPVGGWAQRAATRGGVSNAQACGSLLVFFDPGGNADLDYVMVGTGELQGFGRPPIRPVLGGIGVLAARGPATKAPGDNPWEPESGIALFEGRGIFRLARDPKSTAGLPAGAGLDRVVAGTSAGLFLGIRKTAPLPHGGEFTWVAKPALRVFMGGFPAGVQPFVTDVLWLPTASADGRIVVALARGVESVTAPAPPGGGVAYSDDLGATFTWVKGLDPTKVGAEKTVGRLSLANPAAGRVYVLGERQQTVPPPVKDIATLWRIESMSAAAPEGLQVGAMPQIWTASPTTKKNQRDYDQALAVEDNAGVDRVYLGGNIFNPPIWITSLWCFDVKMPARTLAAVPGVSRKNRPELPPAPPTAGDGARTDGLIGNDVHADVHAIRLAGPAGLGRHVWVACDGGVYVSAKAGRVFTFAARSTGLAAVEVQFHAPHPASTHFGAIGTQDNGRHVRIGDVVWEDLFGGDGGGVAIHPNASHFIVAQYTYASWDCNQFADYVDPLDQGGGVPAATLEREDNLSSFYSGPAAVRQSPLIGRLAIGTNRVWLTDDLGSGAVNTWNVLPYAPGAATNPRPGGLDAPADQKIGVPTGAPLPALSGDAKGALGPVITLKWASPTVLLVMFSQGLVRWNQDPVTKNWSTTLLVAPPGVSLPAITGAPSLSTTMLSDVAPVPGTSDFYLVTTGDPAAAGAETCLYFTDSDKTFRTTGLRAELAALDPAYAAIVDPGDNTKVYVGTVTGVWRGERQAGPPTPADWPHSWDLDVNGLPQAAVQDLSIWATDPPVAGNPRLLRASMQSRGVWEMDLTADEPQRTYLRVHAADDRRRLPTPMADPRQAPAAPATVPYASPDIVVRPRPSPAAAPTWKLGPADTIRASNPVEYQLWTFQTAFRWLYPSVAADGRWSKALGGLVELHRSTKAALGPVDDKINKALWDEVVGTTRVDASGHVNLLPGDPLAVYVPPWHTPAAMSAAPTEIDLIDNVVWLNVAAGVAEAFNEPSTVDVLIHHRDTRPLAVNDAFAILLWRTDAAIGPMLSPDISPLLPYVASAIAGGPVPAAPAGWNRVLAPAGGVLHRLPAALDARMPRAVSIDVDLSAVPDNHHVLFVAVAGSSVDPCPPPVGLPATPTITDLVTRWPYAAVRVVKLSKRT